MLHIKLYAKSATRFETLGYYLGCFPLRMFMAGFACSVPCLFVGLQWIATLTPKNKKKSLGYSFVRVLVLDVVPNQVQFQFQFVVPKYQFRFSRSKYCSIFSPNYCSSFNSRSVHKSKISSLQKICSKGHICINIEYPLIYTYKTPYINLRKHINKMQMKKKKT